MEGTCNAKECKFHDLLGGEVEQCPNFMRTGWRNQEGEVKMLEDCAPRRILLMLQGLENRSVGLQQAQEQQRNESRGINILVRKAMTYRLGETNGSSIE